MSSDRRLLHTFGGLILIILVAAVVLTGPRVSAAWAVPEQDGSAEVRALWVLRTSLASPASIAALVRSAREHGFNTLLVQVRGRGDAYYNGGSEPRATELLRQSAAFDPLDTVVTAAHASGLRVHAWINLNLVASAVLLPTSREHLVNRHPEWLMVPRDIAPALARLPAGSPAYVARLAKWTRTQPADVEGLYASPLVPAAVDHLVEVVRDVAKRYPVDGLHFDYARYPTDRFDYSRTALAEFRSTVRPRLDAGLRRRLDDREKVNLFAYTEALPDDWRMFRVSRMTTVMRRLRAVVKAERPDALVSVATKPELRDAYDARFQDWGSWLQHGIVDVVCPMAYAPQSARFAGQIEAARAAASGGTIWAGIGAYRLSPAQTVANIRTARRLGATGVVLFSYDSLSDPRVSVPGYLAQVARAAFSAPVPAPQPGPHSR